MSGGSRLVNAADFENNRKSVRVPAVETKGHIVVQRFKK